MQIIGIGTGGSKIAGALSQIDGYSCLAIDNRFNDNNPNLIKLKIEEQETFKDYEEKTFLDISDKIVDNEVHVFLFGGGKTTGSVLRILEGIKDKKINIHYIKPEKSFLSSKQVLRERATFGILQEMSRSAIFERIMLYDTEAVLNGAEVSFLHKNNLVVKTVADTFHMMNYVKSSQGVFSNTEKPTEINRIGSFGVVNPKNGEEVLYFSLDTQREKCYYFVMNNDALQKPGLVEKINNQLKRDDASCSFKIVESQWENNHVYVEAFTNVVQTSQNQTEE
tara:strand:- start:1288 stop:2127 length:840 start_codon:yes stop_codon:yes gene_type:complete